jgi:hypothetical protein
MLQIFAMLYLFFGVIIARNSVNAVGETLQELGINYTSFDKFLAFLAMIILGPIAFTYGALKRIALYLK